MPCPGKRSRTHLARHTDTVTRLAAPHGVSLTLLLLLTLLLSAGAGRCADVPQAFQDAYKRFSAQVNPNNLRQTVDTLAGFGSRVAGYPGERRAEEYVEQQFKSLGLQNIKSDPFPITVPYDLSVDTPTEGAFAQLLPNSTGINQPPATSHQPLSAPLRLYPLWPNLVRTPTLPVNGLTAPLIYVGDGKLRNFNGKDVDGSIVMVDFNCAAEWMNAPRLGARAIIFVAPNTTMRGEAEAKFVSIPIAIPRFFMTKKEAAPLLAACAGGMPPTLKLTCNMPWKTRTCRNFTGIIPGTDPKLKDQIIVVQSYFDSTSLIPALAPGADTACGFAAMCEMIRAFKANPPKRTLMFVATSAHFQALQGIREYVHQHIDDWIPGNWFNHKSTPTPQIYLWAGLDLTSQTRSFGIFYKGWFYDYREDIQGRFSDIGRVCRENAEKVGTTLGFEYKRYFNDGINPVDGKNWRNYIPGKPAFDSEVVTMAGGNGVTFASTDDSRALVDTPYDTVDHVNIANLAQQCRLLNSLMWHIVTDTNALGDINAQRMPVTEPSKWSRMALQGGFATVQGRVQVFNPRKSFIAAADSKLANSLVVVRNRNKSFMGVRGNMIQRTQWTTPDQLDRLELNADGMPAKTDPQTGDAIDKQGRPLPPSNFFAFHGIAPLTAYGLNKPVLLAAYHLDERDTITDEGDAATGKPASAPVPNSIPNPARGEIDYAPDLGTSGAKYIPLELMITTSTKETPIIVFRAVPTAIYDLVDQQSLRALTSIDVYDGESNGEPRMYGFAIDPQDPTLVGSYVEDVAVLFSQPGSRLKIAMSSGPGAIRLLLVNSQYDPAQPFKPGNQAEGIGYLVAGNPKDAQNADLLGTIADLKYDAKQEIARSGAIYDTALHVAQDMWKLDDFRMRRLAKYKILNMDGKEGVSDLHRSALKSIEAAEKARAEKDWERFDAESRAAWGFESRAYPDVQQMALDVVKGVIFYLALLLPFAYFMERLLFGFFDLKRQLAAAAGIFILVFIIFSQVHPAFDILQSSPLIVLLAFIMLALSGIVIAMISGKFEEQIKQMNSGAGVHTADIGRVSVAIAAFNLGISNMRRRKTRTFLTCVTLVLLTFTVLSFTSIVQALRFNKVPAPSDHGPRYNGIMIRTALWEPLQEPAYRLLSDEYGHEHAVAPRAWFFGTQMGEQSFLTLKRADKSYDARALCGLSPEEARITRPQEALEPGGRWFQPGDTYSIILPDTIAAVLRVDNKDVGTARVSYSGVEYTVIGILNSQRLKELADLDNEILTPVDFIAMNKQGKSGGGDAGFKEYTHLEPDQVFFVPYQTATNLGGELRSIGIDFGNPKTVLKDLQPLMHRLGLNLYAGQILHPEIDGPERGQIDRFSSIASSNSEGLEMVFFPILIAAMIVLNTMLGSVFERIKEIHIFSSIGLSPSHIGMLFIAEAMVYAILGSVAGYLLGQFTSKLLVATGWFPDLYLNFSSTSAVLTTLIVVAVVLLSTIYPARKASEVASPALDRNWKVPEPEGDHWVVPMPFAVTGDQATGLNGFLGEWFAAYEEYSIGDFVTQGVLTEEFEAEYGTAYRIKCMTWLAPFDLGVSQRIAIETLPTDTKDVYEIRLLVDRESGDISNWKRVNTRFLNTLRKQFLIWRTLKQSDRDRYQNEAKSSQDGSKVEGTEV